MKSKRQKTAVFWFRRDLRLEDNIGLTRALEENEVVIPLFIYDKNILDDLSDKADRRVDLISQTLSDMHRQLRLLGSSMLVLKGRPLQVFSDLLGDYDITNVYTNHDYEPYAIQRDVEVCELLATQGILFKTYKDQCVFEKNEVVKHDGSPYTVFTPYSKQWKAKLDPSIVTTKTDHSHFYQFTAALPLLESIGFRKTEMIFKKPDLKKIDLTDYKNTRDLPMLDATSRLSQHLRFGTVSVRQVLMLGLKQNEAFVNELIWRDFFMMILFNFPDVTYRCFKPAYEKIIWRNNDTEFQAWCQGQTGYPLVDAGMRELLATGFMHNRVRMVCASFLVKHLLIDWRWGEAWFAAKLIDYDLSANNGNWQWAAGCGCDAAPYFRIFNPLEQQKKFDKDFIYIKRWVPEFGTNNYAEPIVEHVSARLRALSTYKKALAFVDN